MKVTGYDLRSALTKLNNRKGILLNQWDNSQYVFEGEKADPKSIEQKIKTIESRIVNIQLAQSEYNSKVMVSVNNKGHVEEMHLSMAIKTVGPTRRLSAMWKRYSQEGNEDIYGRRRGRSRIRDAETVESKRVLSVEECMNQHESYQDLELVLAAAIAKGNAQVVDIVSLLASDLDVEV